MMWQIKLLGSLEIEENGRSAPLMKSAKGCGLLAYLIITGQAQSRETAADFLWESTTTAQSLTRLRVLLSRTRKLTPGLYTTRKALAFHAAPDISVDYLTLDAALDSDDPLRLDAALQLYRGDLLGSFYLGNAPRFDEWLAIERERLRRRTLIAYQRLCEIYMKQETWTKGVDAARRWLALDELDEDALQTFMQFLAANGQIESALQQYELTREQLYLEMEVAPSPITQALAEKLQRLKEEKGNRISWDTITASQIKFPPPDQLSYPGPLPPCSILPHPRNPDFVGRKQSLLYLARLFLHQSAGHESMGRIAAITGMGGLGKTQLAIEFAYRYGRYFPGGVYWLSFAESENVAEEMVKIGGEQGLGVYRDTDNLSIKDKVKRVQKSLQEVTPRLLIFDNCEEETLLTKWLPMTGGCRVLLTSRRATWGHELNIQNRLLPVLNMEESTAYLQKLATALSVEEASQISEELGRLPLALHLAGNFLKKYTEIPPLEYLDQLRNQELLQHPSLSGRGSSSSPTGHYLDVARTFAVNFQHLDPANELDATALHFLGCAAQFSAGEPIPYQFLMACGMEGRGDFTALHLAEDGVARLVSLGLLRIEGRKIALMHRLLVAFAKVSLLEVQLSKAQNAVEKILWETVRPGWEYEASLGTLPIPAYHISHIADTAANRKDVMAARLTHLWGRHLLDLGQYDSCKIYLEMALGIYEERGDQEHVEAADVLMTLGTLIWQRDADEKAKEMYQRSQSIYLKNLAPNHIKIARCCNNLGLIHSRSRQFSDAQALFEKGIAIIEGLSDANPHDASRLYFNLGVLHNRNGEFTTGERYFKRVLATHDELHTHDTKPIFRTLKTE